MIAFIQWLSKQLAGSSLYLTTTKKEERLTDFETNMNIIETKGRATYKYINSRTKGDKKRATTEAEVNSIYSSLMN